MRKFLSTYENPYEKKINFGLMNREFDKSLVEHLLEMIKSTTIIENIKILGWEYTEDATKIDYAEHNQTRASRKKKKDEPPEIFLSLEDTLVGELTVHIELTMDDEKQVIHKKILVPLVDRYGYYMINGKRSFIIYQLVDSSTYSKGTSLVLKSIRPVVLINRKADGKKNLLQAVDVHGHSYSTYTFELHIIRKYYNIFLLYFAKLGADAALRYFAIDPIVSFVDDADMEDTVYLYFPINKNLFLRVHKNMFIEDWYTKVIVGSIYRVCTNRLSRAELNNKDYWLERIGAYTASKSYKYLEKGIETMNEFERMIDSSTFDILKLHDENKTDNYAIIRWMCQNYRELRKKDDVDLRYKRVRSSEYIIALISEDINSRVDSVITMGKRAKMKNLEDLFKFPSSIVIRRMLKSKVLRFDERANDMDMWSKFKYTSKGPNSLGGKDPRRIPSRNRDVHPSHLGIFDINVCGSSDPGLSGVITPFAKVSGMHFSSEYEPEDGISETLRKIRDVHNIVLDKRHEELIEMLGDSDTEE